MDLALTHKQSSLKTLASKRAVTAMRETQRKALNSLAAKSLRRTRQQLSSESQAPDLEKWKRSVKRVFDPQEEEEEEDVIFS